MRLKNIILTDLINDQLKAQEKIERAVNNFDDIDEVCDIIKKGLRELVILESMISKWQVINPTFDTGDENNKNNE